MNAVFSRVDLDNSSISLSLEFNDCVDDLLHCSSVEALDNFHQHFKTSRLQHSLNVSYYSFLACRFLRFDYRSAARAGLLHDLYHYDWREEKSEDGWHAKAHPKAALRNAKEITSLNGIEEDAISKHMWPLTLTPPKYKESYVVTLVDKYCASAEFALGIKNAIAAAFLLSFRE